MIVEISIIKNDWNQQEVRYMQLCFKMYDT
jgi:hypothetical protein